MPMRYRSARTRLALRILGWLAIGCCVHSAACYLVMAAWLVLWFVLFRQNAPLPYYCHDTGSCFLWAPVAIPHLLAMMTILLGGVFLFDMPIAPMTWREPLSFLIALVQYGLVWLGFALILRRSRRRLMSPEV